MSLALAVDDLLTTLSTFDVFDKVETVRPIPGRPNIHLGISLGGHTQDKFYGLTKYRQELELTLTIKTSLDPATVSDVLREIDKEIVSDRRRSGTAQTTILNEEGWSPEEPENGKGHILSRTVEVVYHEHDD